MRAHKTVYLSACLLKMIGVKNIIIVNCYGPPTGNIENFITLLEIKLLSLDGDTNYVFVTGDIFIDMNSNACNNVKQLKTTMEQLGFSQFINKTT